MATPAADRVVLDTNILLAATDYTRAEHVLAVEALDVWLASGLVLYTSGQLLREYLAVATRPTERDGLGMGQSDAVADVSALRSRLRFLTEDARAADRLTLLLGAVTRTGAQVHDANIVAAMLVHGIDTVVTSNVDDFRRFDAHVEVTPLRS